MGHEKYIHEVLTTQTPPSVETEITELAPTPEVIREADEVIARASRFDETDAEIVKPTLETRTPKKMLEDTHAIIAEMKKEIEKNQMILDAKRAGSFMQTSAPKTAPATGEDYTKWTDPRYHNGREEKPRN